MRRVSRREIWQMQFSPPGAPLSCRRRRWSSARVSGANARNRGDAAWTECVGGEGGLTLLLDFDPWYMRFVDEDGRRSIAARIRRTSTAWGDHSFCRLALPTGMRRRSRHSYHLRPDEHLFGLGEKFTPLDKRGQRIISWTQDAFGSTSERSHKNIPFLISTRGYGLFLDTGARMTWELGTVSAQSYTMTVDGSTLEAYMISGQDACRHSGALHALTGRAPVPPKWSFGRVDVGDGGAARSGVDGGAGTGNRGSLELPVDVIHVDTWWMKWRQYCDFRWDGDVVPGRAGLHRRAARARLQADAVGASLHLGRKRSVRDWQARRLFRQATGWRGLRD